MNNYWTLMFYICQWSFPQHSTPCVIQVVFDLLITNVILFVQTANKTLQNSIRVIEIVNQWAQSIICNAICLTTIDLICCWYIHIWIEFLTLLDSLGPDSLYRWARPRTGKAFPAFRSHCPFLSLSFPQPVRFPGTKLLGTFQKLFLWTLIVVIVVVVETI